MFFYLAPPRAEISDASGPLIQTYKAVRQDVEKVIKFLAPLKPDRPTFEKVKMFSPSSQTDAGAAFIFLNKCCWNGLFRVNSGGLFNVPYGAPKTDFIIDPKNLKRCATQLRRRSVSIRCQDFSAIFDRVCKGDFVFLDPPYVTSHNMNGFADWNERLFSWNDQVRLASLARELARRGANVLVTNADHSDIHQLYSGFLSKQFVRRSTLASDPSRRNITTEAVFLGGPEYDCFPSSIHRRKISHDGRVSRAN